MFDNLSILAIVIIIFWLAGFAYYVYTSRQQQDLESEIASLRELLQGDEE